MTRPYSPHSDRAKAEALVGKRIEIPVHLDLWMRGARYGTVVRASRNGEYVKVKLDDRRNQLKLHAHHYDYVKEIT